MTHKKHDEMNLRTEKRRQFVENMLRLGLHHCWREMLGGKDFSETLGLHSPIYRLTVLWDGHITPATPGFDPEKSPWGDLVHELEKQVGRHQDSSASFEAAGFDRLWPLAEPRIEIDCAAWPWVPEGFSVARIPDEHVFGCFAYEWAKNHHTAFFHIGNACMPESPFKDIGARREELLEMIDKMVDERPLTEFIACNSWLNSLPRFQTLFPPEYPKHDQVSGLGMGYNWWGQFMRRDGGFHEKNGEAFRHDGRFPFASIEGRCLISRLKQHLNVKEPKD